MRSLPHDGQHHTPERCMHILTTVFPFSRCHIVGVIQYGAFSDWLLSLSNTYLSFLCVFSWPDSSFLFSAEKISLSEYIPDCLFIRLLKDIFVASQLWRYWIKLLWTPSCRFLFGQEFSAFLGKYKGVLQLDWVVRACLVFQETVNCHPK